MIQRKQTLYLLAAAALMAATLFMPLATYLEQGGEYTLKGLAVSVPVVYLSILLALATLLPLVIVFLYKNRFLQMRLCFTETVLQLGAQGFIAYYIYNVYKGFDVISWKFGIASAFPIPALIFTILAIRAILHDHNLIKSLDRIR